MSLSSESVVEGIRVRGAVGAIGLATVGRLSEGVVAWVGPRLYP